MGCVPLCLFPWCYSLSPHFLSSSPSQATGPHSPSTSSLASSCNFAFSLHTVQHLTHPAALLPVCLLHCSLPACHNAYFPSVAMIPLPSANIVILPTDARLPLPSLILLLSLLSQLHFFLSPCRSIYLPLCIPLSWLPCTFIKHVTRGINLLVISLSPAQALQ